MNKSGRVYLLLDGAESKLEKVSKNIYPKTSLYGGFDLEKEGFLKIRDYTLKNILKLKRGDIVITNRTKYVLLMKILGIRILLISMNSNHDLTRKKGVKKLLSYLFEIINYKFCNKIICLSNAQVNGLEKIGIRDVWVVPLGVDADLIGKVKRSSEYIFSSGGDAGRNYDFIRNALEGFDLKILEGGNPLPYDRYLEAMGRAKVVVFNINANKKSSSDLSGSTTCFEALLLGKPVIINYQPWLKELLKDNYYIYKNEKELQNLVKRKLKFKNKDYNHIKLSSFEKRLKEIVKIIS